MPSLFDAMFFGSLAWTVYRHGFAEPKTIKLPRPDHVQNNYIVRDGIYWSTVSWVVEGVPVEIHSWRTIRLDFDDAKKEQ